ncbi:molecular chaperone [Neonectria punicea]|uniref:Molecular chaperone n=1 Tax=Neonectria punicea TaxID=979145 RepID=A0ABR1H5Z4_9HYPO
MRPSVASVAAARDLSRLCVRCRLRVRRASSLAALPTTTRPSAVATPIGTAAPTPGRLSAVRGLSSPSPVLLQTRRASGTSESVAPSPSPPPPQTHYDLFPETLPDGPPPSGHFPIDTRALRREFLRLQARAHPDMHSAENKVRAEATSARINDAYKTLTNPLTRAQYLLALRGVDVANDEALKVEEPELLMQVLEAHEEMEDAESEADLQGLREENDGRIAASEQALEYAFQHDDVDAAKHEAVRLRYWVNIKEGLDNWEKGKEVVLGH